ncbi:MAG: AmmeMemoRadiSam system protein B [Anaerolineae bacterium]|nr:AmmeMemoRadiSam system protein B [Anaerolineae bacterium]
MSQTVRRSVIAGQWYPGDARELERTIERFFSNVVPEESNSEAIGLISPHAGYVYSGQVAAHAYNQVRGKSFDVVVMLSPVHRMPVGPYAVTVVDAYQTPLGDVPLDMALVDAVGKELPLTRLSRDNEHSLEIQLPFLQVALGDFRLLPVMIGESSFDVGIRLGQVLAELLKDKTALIVASSDMHHIEDYEQVVRRDKVVIDAIASLDMARIKDALSPWDCSVCGRIPIYAMLTAVKALGARRIKILAHTNSGDVTGIRVPGQYTVGYMAAAVYAAEREE